MLVPLGWRARGLAGPRAYPCGRAIRRGLLVRTSHPPRLPSARSLRAQVRLVTFGQSFQWTDGPRVAEAVYDMLEPGGVLALIGHTVAGRPRPPSPGIPPIPHDDIEALVRKYLGSPAPRTARGTSPTRTHRFEDVLERTRFGSPRVVFLPGIANLVRSSESVLSGYFSLSWSVPRLFGDRVDDFAHEVRELLAVRSPDGVFWDWPGDTEIVMATKPN